MMKVLWFSPTPSLYDESTSGGWIGSLQRILSLNEQIELAIAFEYIEDRQSEMKDGVMYYPMYNKLSFVGRVRKKTNAEYYWNKIRTQMLSIIKDYKPELIQCFGSEWPYGRIASCVDIPVIIHMQGFHIVYNECSSLVYSNADLVWYNLCRPSRLFARFLSNKRIKAENESERLLMRDNKYFLGRTNWDRELVRYYSPNSKYFYCPEALRPEIYNYTHLWTYKERDIRELITITSASVLKGNEIILRTASVLKNEFGFSFVWRVAGNTETFKLAERKTRICHKDCNIELLGTIKAEEVSKELEKADMYIHPAVIDNSPNSLCEAQIIGCPVIATNVGGIPQLVEDYKTGVLYPYNEPHTLAFLIMSLCKNEKTLKALSANEHRVAKQRHDPNTISDAILRIYNSILKEIG